MDTGGVLVAERELFQAAAHAMSVRAHLDSLLIEALTAPGMCLQETEKIAALVASGELQDAHQALRRLREQG